MPQRLKIFEEPKNLSPVFAYVHNEKMTIKQNRNKYYFFVI